MSAYGRDLAHIHDTGWGDFARDASPGLLRMLARAHVREGLVVDLGCGSGIWARELADAGYDVLGIDLSEDMLAIASRRVPEARFMRASAFDADLPDCVAVTSIGECLGYAFDERSGREALARLFERAHAALSPGGLLIFDIPEPGRERPRRGWYEGDGWILCLDVRERGARLVRDITVFAREGDLYRRVHERHEVVLHEPETVLADLAAAGFAPRVLRGYGPDLRFRRGVCGYLAIKRA